MAYWLQVLDYRLHDWRSGIYDIWPGGRGNRRAISLVKCFRTGSGNHHAFYPVRSRGSVPRCKASSVANNSSSSSIRLYGDMHNLWLLTCGKWGLGFSGTLRISLKSKGPCMELLSHCAICLYGVCVCVHVCVSLLYINYVIVGHFHFKCLSSHMKALQ